MQADTATADTQCSYSIKVRALSRSVATLKATVLGLYNAKLRKLICVSQSDYHSYHSLSIISFTADNVDHWETNPFYASYQKTDCLHIFIITCK